MRVNIKLASASAQILSWAGRLLLAGVFLLAAVFKFVDNAGTVRSITDIGLPFPEILSYAAGMFELAIVASFLTRKFETPIALAAAAYVLALALMFHGPNQWTTNYLEFVIFTNHLVYIAALMFVAAESQSH